MPTTSIQGLPYPASTDTPDVPRDIGALADALDGGVVKRIWAGSVSVTATASSTGTAPVTFPAGLFTTPPKVLVQTQATAVWVGIVSSSVTTTGCTVGILHNTGASATATVTVNVLAVQYT